MKRLIIDQDATDPGEFLHAFVDRLHNSDRYSCPPYAAGLRSKIRSGVVAPIFRSIVELSDAGDLLAAFRDLACPKLFMYGDANRSLRKS